MNTKFGQRAYMLNIGLCQAIIIPLLQRRGEYTGLALSVLPSLTNIVCLIFLINHASQPLQNWYGASAKGPTHRLQNSGSPVVYFLFYDILSVTNVFRHTYISNHASQPLQTWYGASAWDPTGHLPSSDLLVIYFLFYNFGFPTCHS